MVDQALQHVGQVRLVRLELQPAAERRPLVEERLHDLHVPRVQERHFQEGQGVAVVAVDGRAPHDLQRVHELIPRLERQLLLLLPLLLLLLPLAVVLSVAVHPAAPRALVARHALRAPLEVGAEAAVELVPQPLQELLVVAERLELGVRRRRSSRRGRGRRG